MCYRPSGRSVVLALAALCALARPAGAAPFRDEATGFSVALGPPGTPTCGLWPEAIRTARDWKGMDLEAAGRIQRGQQAAMAIVRHKAGDIVVTLQRVANRFHGPLSRSDARLIAAAMLPEGVK